MTIEQPLAQTTDLHESDRPTNLMEGTDSLSAFARRAEALRRNLDHLDQLAGKSGARAVSRLKAQLDGFEPAVTILGQVKSGKTTLINAMAGWADLLPSDVNPWTSVVTSLHLSPGKTRSETSARFTFMTAAEWDRLSCKGGRMGELAGRAGADGELDRIRHQIEMMRQKSRRRLGSKFELLMGQQHEYGYFDKNLLERYICLGDDFEDEPATETMQGRFADITRSADLYLNCRTIPYRLCLRDTPGVNDTFLMREQVTINAVRDSRICVVVLSAGQALSSVDMGLIRLISTLRSRDVVLFVNRIDELAKPSEQIPEIEASIRQVLADHQGPKDTRIIFGSAYWANRVLCGELEEIDKRSSAALVDWAEAALRRGRMDPAPHNMVWNLSGVPELLGALSEMVVEDLGSPLLTRVARSALTIASGIKATQSITVTGSDDAPKVSRDRLPEVFKRFWGECRVALERDLDEVFSEFGQRADKSQQMFVDRATYALVEHLEIYGDGTVWDYDPIGLRVTLKSAYTAMARHVHRIMQDSFEDALADLARLLHAGFGPLVEGIEIAAPDVPRVAPPIVLGQTIALDFNDGWWVMWWRKTRGFQAFAAKFRKLILAETEDFMTQMKIVQVNQVRQTMLAAFDAFFEEQSDLLQTLLSSQGSGADLSALGSTGANREDLDRTVNNIRRYAS